MLHHGRKSLFDREAAFVDGSARDDPGEAPAVGFERSERPVMWLAPHFMALDVAGASTNNMAPIAPLQSNE